MLLHGIYTFYISACTNHATVTLQVYSKVILVLPLSPYGIMCAQEGKRQTSSPSYVESLH
jgi:hypothetical protein